MVNYKKIIQISELGLRGDREKLLKLLQEIAIEEINNGKHSLYNGLTDLISKNNSPSKLQPSSFTGNTKQSFSDSYFPEKIWISPKIEKQISNFLHLYRNKDSLGLSKLNHLNKIFLYGPPGTGKTTLGFHIAKELGKSVRYVRISDVVSSKFGETIKNLSDIFDTSTEDVIFIDEFDAFAKKREDNNDVGELKRIVNAIIQILDFQTGNKVIIVATNLIGSIDPAILRRFSSHILVEPLDNSELKDFFNFLIKQQEQGKVNLSSQEIDIILTFLKGQTLDSIKSIFDKVILNTLLGEEKTINLKVFITTLALGKLLGKKDLKILQKKNPGDFLKLTKILSNSGYTQQEVCDMFGLHRNSYKKYFQ